MQDSAVQSLGVPASASPEDSGSDEYGPQETVTVEVDNTTTPAYSLVSLQFLPTFPNNFLEFFQVNFDIFLLFRTVVSTRGELEA